MSKLSRIDYYELMDIVTKTERPFGRKSIFGTAKSDLGKGRFTWHDLGNGIAVSDSRYRLCRDAVVSLCSNVPGAVLIFNLGDSFTHTFKDQRAYSIRKNSFFIGLSSEDFRVEMTIPCGTNYHSFTIGIKEAFFLTLAHNFHDAYRKIDEARQKGYAILEGGEIDPVQAELLQCLETPYDDESLLSNLFFESKTTALLHYSIESIVNSLSKQTALDLNPDKINALERAKQLILNHYSQPLSIKEIAHRSATNECYLKKDFKAYYGMTIYEMIRKKRLENAKALLRSTHSVKEAALSVGYKHTGHFSKLFSHYFGVTPSAYKKGLQR